MPETLVIAVVHVLLLYHVVEPVFLYTTKSEPEPPLYLPTNVTLLQFALQVYELVAVLLALPPRVYPVEHVLMAHLFHICLVDDDHVGVVHVLAPVVFEHVALHVVAPVMAVVLPPVQTFKPNVSV